MEEEGERGDATDGQPRVERVRARKEEVQEGAGGREAAFPYRLRFVIL